MRGAPYTATLTAVRCEPVIKAFAKRLTLINVMVRDGIAWDPLVVKNSLLPIDT